MTRDASAFLADRLLCDLDQNLLALFQQVGDLGKILRLIPSKSASASAAATAPWTGAVKRRPACTLRVCGSRGWSSHFSTRVYCPVCTAFRVEQRLRFRLGLFQFSLRLGRFIDFFFCLYYFGCLRRNRLG